MYPDGMELLDGLEPSALIHLMEFARSRGFQEFVDCDWVVGSIISDDHDFAAQGILYDLNENGVAVPGDLADELRAEFYNEDDILELLDAMTTVAA